MWAYNNYLSHSFAQGFNWGKVILSIVRLAKYSVSDLMSSQSHGLSDLFYKTPEHNSADMSSLIVCLRDKRAWMPHGQISNFCMTLVSNHSNKELFVRNSESILWDQVRFSFILYFIYLCFNWLTVWVLFSIVILMNFYRRPDSLVEN